VGASRFVGRVGGLAMALGVGAAVFTGYGVAWADGSSSSDAGPKNTNQHSSSSGSATSQAAKTTGAASATASKKSTTRSVARPPRPACRVPSPRRPPLLSIRRLEAMRRCRLIPRWRWRWRPSRDVKPRVPRARPPRRRWSPPRRIRRRPVRSPPRRRSPG